METELYDLHEERKVTKHPFDPYILFRKTRSQASFKQHRESNQSSCRLRNKSSARRREKARGKANGKHLRK